MDRYGRSHVWNHVLSLGRGGIPAGAADSSRQTFRSVGVAGLKARIPDGPRPLCEARYVYELRAPEAARRCIGSHLYAALFEAVRTEDIRTYIAGITLPNPASIALHERSGFVPVGTMRSVGRKFGTYWDVRWYEKLAAD